MTSLDSGCFCLATTVVRAAYQLISPADAITLTFQRWGTDHNS